MLQEAIEGLKGQQQQILKLRFNEGKTQTEIADHIGVSQMHVSRLLRRALEDLRVELEQWNGTASYLRIGRMQSSEIRQRFLDFFESGATGSTRVRLLSPTTTLLSS